MIFLHYMLVILINVMFSILGIRFFPVELPFPLEEAMQRANGSSDDIV